jgi:hypothetical protein
VVPDRLAVLVTRRLSAKTNVPGSLILLEHLFATRVVQPDWQKIIAI